MTNRPPVPPIPEKDREMTYRLGITAFGRKCTISKRSKKDPQLAIGNVQDAHNDFLHCVLDWLEHGKIAQVIHVGDGKNYRITCVEEIEP